VTAGRVRRRVTTLVWVDAEEAIIVRWADRAVIERVRPAGRSRAEPGERAGRERLAAFLRDVAAHVPETDDVRVVGPGIVRVRLERALRTGDRCGAHRVHVRSASADRLSEQMLVTRVQTLAGDAAVGAPPGEGAAQAIGRHARR